MFYLTELVNGSMGLKHNITYITLHQDGLYSLSGLLVANCEF